MSQEKNTPDHKDSAIRKQNMDYPNIPASSEKIDSENKVENEIKETSKLHDDGKTDNTEQVKE